MQGQPGSAADRPAVSKLLVEVCFERSFVNDYFATGRVDPKLMEFIRGLKVGDRIRITSARASGPAKMGGRRRRVYRDLNFLTTGLATQRVPDDDIVMPTLHFTKDNGEFPACAG